MCIRDSPVEFSFLPLTQYSGADLVEYGSYSELLESYYACLLYTSRCV